MKKIISSGCLSVFSLFGAYDDHQISDWQSEYDVKLEDGSVWHIKSDADEVMRWKDDMLSFEAAETWFDDKTLCYFINKRNNKKIEVSLVSAPEVYNASSHWIAFLNPKNFILFLDNGVIFSLYENDREIFKNWKADDFVIVGDYTSVLSKSKNILFNYRTKEFVFGELN
jgi:hypothetical protein